MKSIYQTLPAVRFYRENSLLGKLDKLDDEGKFEEMFKRIKKKHCTLLMPLVARMHKRS